MNSFLLRPFEDLFYSEIGPIWILLVKESGRDPSFRRHLYSSVLHCLFHCFTLPNFFQLNRTSCVSIIRPLVGAFGSHFRPGRSLKVTVSLSGLTSYDSMRSPSTMLPSLSFPAGTTEYLRSLG